MSERMPERLTGAARRCGSKQELAGDDPPRGAVREPGQQRAVRLTANHGPVNCSVAVLQTDR